MDLCPAAETQVYVLLTRWPTLDVSPQTTGPLVVRVDAGFKTDGCGAMTTGDWVAVVTKGWKKTNYNVSFSNFNAQLQMSTKDHF